LNIETNDIRLELDVPEELKLKAKNNLDGIEKILKCKTG